MELVEQVAASIDQLTKYMNWCGFFEFSSKFSKSEQLSFLKNAKNAHIAITTPKRFVEITKDSNQVFEQKNPKAGYTYVRLSEDLKILTLDEGDAFLQLSDLALGNIIGLNLHSL
jgi:superfamily II DNA/RNA helicase